MVSSINRKPVYNLCAWNFSRACRSRLYVFVVSAGSEAHKDVKQTCVSADDGTPPPQMGVGYIRKRSLRLLPPYLFWGTMTWILFFCFHKTGYIDEGYTVEQLLLQLCFGSCTCAALWFHFCLITITFLFIFLYFFVPEKEDLFLSFILIGCLFLQYSGLNHRCFQALRYEMKWPLGRIVEMIPYAAMGFICQKINLINKLNTRRTFSLFALVSIFFVVHFYSPFVTPKGFYCQGLYLFCTAVTLTIAFIIFPFHFLPRRVQTKVFEFSRFSMGIYILHLPLSRALTSTVFRSDPQFVGTFSYCVMVYFLSFMVSYLISKIPYMSLTVK